MRGHELHRAAVLEDPLPTLGSARVGRLLPRALLHHHGLGDILHPVPRGAQHHALTQPVERRVVQPLPVAQHRDLRRQDRVPGVQPFLQRLYLRLHVFDVFRAHLLGPDGRVLGDLLLRVGHELCSLGWILELESEPRPGVASHVNVGPYGDRLDAFRTPQVFQGCGHLRPDAVTLQILSHAELPVVNLAFRGIDLPVQSHTGLLVIIRTRIPNSHRQLGQRGGRLHRYCQSSLGQTCLVQHTPHHVRDLGLDPVCRIPRLPVLQQGSLGQFGRRQRPEFPRRLVGHNRSPDRRVVELGPLGCPHPTDLRERQRILSGVQIPRHVTGSGHHRGCLGVLAPVLVVQRIHPESVGLDLLPHPALRTGNICVLPRLCRALSVGHELLHPGRPLIQPHLHGHELLARELVVAHVQRVAVPAVFTGFCGADPLGAPTGHQIRELVRHKASWAIQGLCEDLRAKPLRLELLVVQQNVPEHLLVLLLTREVIEHPLGLAQPTLGRVLVPHVDPTVGARGLSCQGDVPQWLVIGELVHRRNRGVQQRPRGGLHHLGLGTGSLRQLPPHPHQRLILALGVRMGELALRGLPVHLPATTGVRRYRDGRRPILGGHVPKRVRSRGREGTYGLQLPRLGVSHNRGSDGRTVEPRAFRGTYTPDLASAPLAPCIYPVSPLVGFQPLGQQTYVQAHSSSRASVSDTGIAENL